MIEIAISCDMSQTFRQRMNSEPKQKRERFQQLTQNPKLKTGKVFAADLRKSKIHPTVKKLTAWRKLNQLSQRKAVVVLAQYYFHATFPSLRSWEEGRRSPKKQDPPHGQKTHRLAQTKPIVSTQSGCGPSAILFPRHFRIGPKLGGRASLPQSTYCRNP